jgi:hypothetical protein
VEGGHYGQTAVRPLFEQKGEIIELIRMDDHTAAVRRCCRPKKAVKTAIHPDIGWVRTAKRARTRAGDKMMVGEEDKRIVGRINGPCRWLAEFGHAMNLHLVLMNLHSFWNMQPVPTSFPSLIFDLTNLHRHPTNLRHQVTKILHHQTNFHILRSDEVLYDSLLRQVCELSVSAHLEAFPQEWRWSSTFWPGVLSMSRIFSSSDPEMLHQDAFAAEIWLEDVSC